MSNKFGPWYAVQPEHASGWWVVAKDLEGDETVDASGDGGFEEDVAKFIAAGPDLLKALEEISLCSQNSMSSKDECGRIARAAIAKAKGKT